MEFQLQHPSSEHPGLISFKMDWLDLLAVQGTLNSLLQHHSSKASTLWRSAFFMIQLFSSVQSLSCVQLFETPWTAGCQAPLSFTISQSLFQLMSIESVMSSNHLILCCPLLLPASILPSVRVFSSESTLHQVAKGLEIQLQHQSFQ